MKYSLARAKDYPCPIGRTFATPHKVCMGDKCPVWRWSLGDAPADHRFTSAVTREAVMMFDEWNKANPDKKAKGKEHFLGKATTKVTRNLADYIVPNDETDLGYCGLGGKP